MLGHLTLDEAATRAGVSRWTISRALKSGAILGMRDNRGRWGVSPESLDVWAPEVQRTELHIVQDEQPAPDAQVQLATALARIEGLEARLADTQAERDRLAGLLDKALETRANIGILARLFRRL